MRRFASKRTLNAPWGLALAPDDFGGFSNDVLVGNFGDGAISAFDPTSGKFRGVMRDAKGKKLRIDGLWGLTFGSGTSSGGAANELFFTAGPDDESHGLFGSLSVAEKGEDGKD